MGATVQDGGWELTPADRLLVEAKRWGGRLRFDVLLLLFRARGRFPRAAAEVDEGAVEKLALGVPAPDGPASLLPGSSDRTTERQRAEIRALLGFREAIVADAEELGTWLRDHAVAGARNRGRLAAQLEERCRALRVEPPTPDRVRRIVRGAVRAYENRLHAAIHARWPPEARERLDALLQPPPAGIEAEGEDDPAAAAGARALLNFVRGDPDKPGVAGVTRGLERLETIRAVGLPTGLFVGVPPHEVELCRRRVVVQPPSDLRRLPEPTRLAGLAAYAHLRGRSLTRRSGRTACRNRACHRRSRRAPGGAARCRRRGVCGCIWTPPDCIWTLPDCNDLLGLGLASRLLTYIRLSEAARYARRRKPRWVSARLVLNAPETSAVAVPVHTSGSRGDGP